MGQVHRMIPTVKWITEFGRQRKLGRDVHVVGWLGLGGGGGGGGALVVFCLFVVAQHSFHAIHSQSPSGTLGQDTRDFASDFARDYILPVFIVDRLAFSRLVTSSRSLGCCRSKT